MIRNKDLAAILSTERWNILDKALGIDEKFVSWRRDFHMHPELGFKETRTSALVAEIAERLGCRVRRGVGRTGVVAELG